MSARSLPGYVNQWTNITPSADGSQSRMDVRSLNISPVVLSQELITRKRNVTGISVSGLACVREFSA